MDTGHWAQTVGTEVHEVIMMDKIEFLSVFLQNVLCYFIFLWCVHIDTGYWAQTVGTEVHEVIMMYKI
jgi:hypothetical protein